MFVDLVSCTKEFDLWTRTNTIEQYEKSPDVPYGEALALPSQNNDLNRSSTSVKQLSEQSDIPADVFDPNFSFAGSDNGMVMKSEAEL